MKINLRQPKYVLPLLALPFLFLFYYAWQSSFSKPKAQVKQTAGLNGNVGDVSADVRKKDLTDKLDAYRDAYKDADGMTVVNTIPKEASSNASFHDNYSDKEKKTLDSINRVMKDHYRIPPQDNSDRVYENALTNYSHKVHNMPVVEAATAQQSAPDPMQTFKQQMAYIDSIDKQNDPAFKLEQQKREAAARLSSKQAKEVRLTVVKADSSPNDFNTVKPGAGDNFIEAAIDENVTGYAGSRLRLKLLSDIRAGGVLINKGTLLYAEITGFSEQRVTLVINTILYNGKILPVKLELYDLDGLPGLYVPSSAFRDFTKDLGSNSVQGVTIDGSSGGSQFIMSSVDKIFQSTSSAIADLVRKNKAKMKYNSFVYLIDTQALQNDQKSY